MVFSDALPACGTLSMPLTHLLMPVYNRNEQPKKFFMSGSVAATFRRPGSVVSMIIADSIVLEWNPNKLARLSSTIEVQGKKLEGCR